MPEKRAIQLITNGSPWAIEKSALDTIIQIAGRDHNLDAVLKQRGEPLAHSYSVEVRDGVAIIPVNGPLFPRANLFQQISGATSVQMMAQDLHRIEQDPAIRSAVLMIDSPGGHTTMINEFANQIAAFSKPVTAYVVGQAASAAYWLASAADEIVMDAAAMVGSIGVVAALQSGEDGTIEIVSSNAQDKRPDVSTEEGRAVVQAIVDDMEAVFIDSVMQFRGMSREQVTALRGGVVIGAKAVDKGFADRIGSLEDVINTLQLENPMDAKTLKADHPDVYQAVFELGASSVNAEQLKLSGITCEKERISAILNCEAAAGREAQAKVLALETDMDAESAAKVLAASPKAENSARGDQFSEYMAKIGNPDIGVDDDDDPEMQARAAIDMIVGGAA